MDDDDDSNDSDIAPPKKKAPVAAPVKAASPERESVASSRASENIRATEPVAKPESPKEG